MCPCVRERDSSVLTPDEHHGFAPRRSNSLSQSLGQRVVPILSRTRDHFHGRRPFHFPWGGGSGDGFRTIQMHHIYCALHSYHYYSSSPSAHRALDPGGWGPVLGNCQPKKRMHGGCGQPGMGQTQAESLAEGTQASRSCPPRRQDGRGAHPQQALQQSPLFSPLPASLCPFFSELTTQRTLGVTGHGGRERNGAGGPDEIRLTRFQGASSWATQVLIPVPPCPGSTPSGTSLGTWGPQSPSPCGDANAARPEGQMRGDGCGPPRGHTATTTQNPSISAAPTVNLYSIYNNMKERLMAWLAYLAHPSLKSPKAGGS